MAWYYYAAVAVLGYLEADAANDEMKQAAKVKEVQARNEAIRGADKAAQRAKLNRRITAKQIASYGANGIDLSGTAADVVYQDAIEGAVDVMRIEYNTALAVESLAFEARALRARGKNERNRIYGDTVKSMFTYGASSALSSGGQSGASSIPVEESTPDYVRGSSASSVPVGGS